MPRRTLTFPGFSAVSLSLVLSACSDDPGLLEVDRLMSLTGGCDEEVALTECPDDPLTITGQLRFLDYQDHEDPRDLSLYEPPGDPSPRAVGVWLGSSITPEACANGYDDRDRDGFSDHCEYILARSFAPLMQFTLGEQRIEHFNGKVLSCARGEPYWAVKRFEDTNLVSIAYLPAYYVDCGELAADLYNRQSRVWDIPNEHWGDSEVIRVTVNYNRYTRHWDFYQAFLSAHDGFPVFESSQVVYAGNVEFVAGDRTFMKVWVARNKHANYRSQSVCEGGAVGFDNCDMTAKSAPYYQNRFPVRPGRNIGSPARPLIERAYSQFMPTLRYECFYACTRDFRGWVPTYEDGDPSASFRAFLFKEGVFENLTAGGLGLAAWNPEEDPDPCEDKNCGDEDGSEVH